MKNHQLMIINRRVTIIEFTKTKQKVYENSWMCFCVYCSLSTNLPRWFTPIISPLKKMNEINWDIITLLLFCFAVGCAALLHRQHNHHHTHNCLLSLTLSLLFLPSYLLCSSGTTILSSSLLPSPLSPDPRRLCSKLIDLSKT